MGALPPVARLAVSFSAGATLAHLLGPVPASLLLLLLAALIGACRRPGPRVLLGAAVAAGVTAASAPARAPCAALAGDVLDGYLVAPVREGRGWFRPPGGRCAGEVRVSVPGDAPAGAPLRLRGRWHEGPYGRWFTAARVERAPAPRPSPTRGLVRWRSRLVERLDTLYGARAPMVAALTLARREGLSPELREAFARSGTAHLLAISGFHVGVVALLLVALLRRLGAPLRRADLGAAAGAWLYVALLGFPDAACRAAVILAALAASRARGRPPARWGALGSALLVLVALDPTRLLAPGFQLSFAGAAGLVAWASPLRRRLSAVRVIPPGLASALAAGVAATLATLPVVAWHFERVSLVGVPATLAATPLVVLALPGALASLALDALHPAAGRFLAGGVDVLLIALGEVTRAAARPSWASVWVPRAWIPVAAAGAVAAAGLARVPRVRRTARRGVGLLGAGAALVAWPAVLALQARGTVEVVAVDVGQGDAVALRTPRGRWLLVDAGPAWDGDPAGSPVVRALRRRGVARLEALVLTHADLDHIGGAEAVLAAFDVGVVLDPGLPAGKAAYVALLEGAVRDGTPWRAVARGERLDLDGVEIEVLHPHSRPSRDGSGDGDADTNASSVVLAVRFGAFDVLLTGDAPVSVERAVLPGVGSALEVLKVGHHGSATSTDSLLLARAHPRVALVSVGRGNRYGHPAPEVLARLERAGAEVRRTDREGTVGVVGRRDGTFRVDADGPGRR